MGALCQTKSFLVDTGSQEDSDYQDSRPKLSCKVIGDIIKRHCNTPEERKKNKCDANEKSFKKVCGSEDSDYQDSRPKLSCKVIGDIIKRHCNTPEKRKRINVMLMRNLLRKSVAQRAMTT